MKRMLKFFVIILLFLSYICLSCTFLFLTPSPAAAVSTPTLKNPFDNLQVEIPGLRQLAAEHPAKCETQLDGQIVCETSWINVYIAAIYKYAIGIIGILATLVMMFGGVLWLTAAGNPSRIGEAKAWIGAALTGLLLALLSYLILYQINPALLNFPSLKIKKAVIEKVNVCEWRQVVKNCQEDWGADGWQAADKVSGSCSGTKPVDPAGFYSFACCCRQTFRGDGNDTCEKYNNYLFDNSNAIEYNKVNEQTSIPNACDQYASYFDWAARNYAGFNVVTMTGINVETMRRLLTAIAAAESTCSPQVPQSKAGACGLMQLLPGTAKPFDSRGADCDWLKNNPKESIMIAAQYIAANQEIHKKNLNNIIAGYNGGYAELTSEGKKGPLAPSSDCPGYRAYECCIDVGGLAETQDYVIKVKKYYNNAN